MVTFHWSIPRGRTFLCRIVLSYLSCFVPILVMLCSPLLFPLTISSETYRDRVEGETRGQGLLNRGRLSEGIVD